MTTNASSEIQSYCARLFYNDPTLSSIRLENAKINSSDMKSLSDALKESPNPLKSFSIYQCEFGVDEAKFLAEALKINTTIQLLEIQFCPIGILVIFPLLEALKTSRIIKLVLKNLVILSEDGYLLSKGFKNNSTIVQLSINALGNKVLKDFTIALQENKTIEDLDLSANFANIEGAEAIANLLKVNKTIKSINVSSNFFGNEGLKLIASALSMNSSLQCIDWSYTDVDQKGAIFFKEALKTNNTLKKIIFVGNAVGVSGLRVLTEFSLYRTVKMLCLAHLSLGNDSGPFLFRIIKESSLMKEFDLRDNKIDDTPITYIVEALKTNYCLKKIDLSCNRIGSDNNDLSEKGASLLALLIETTCTLRVLCLEGNSFSHMGIRTLANALRLNKSFILLLLSSAEDREQEIEFFIEAQQINKSVRASFIDDICLKDNSPQRIRLNYLREQREQKEKYFIQAAKKGDTLSLIELLQENEFHLDDLAPILIRTAIIAQQASILRYLAEQGVTQTAKQIDGFLTLVRKDIDNKEIEDILYQMQEL